MKNFTSLITLILLSSYSFAQSHFVLSWTGNGYDQMTINVLSAKILGANLDTGDEIAVFDGAICCGLFVLENPMLDFNTNVNIVASKDEGTGNGYTAGHAITYKFWDSSANKEISTLAAEYIDVISGFPTTPPLYMVDASAFVNLSSNPPVNQPPLSNSGVDQFVNEGDNVTLDGSASSDPDNNTLTYHWTAPAGITLSSNTVARPGFTAPEVNADTDFAFSLIVNDGTVNSIADQVIIRVKQVNKIPIAKAGPDVSVNESTQVTLDGTASSDPDNDAITYKWTAPPGITLNSNNASIVTFTAPEVTTNTPYAFSLIVNDGKVNSVADQIIITVIQVNKAPVANAGTDSNVTERKVFQLNGSLSSDPDNNAISYNWTVPSGISLNSTTVAKPVFTAPDVAVNTNYTFSLIVYDGLENSPADQVTITVIPNKAPIANAGADLTVAQNQTLTLNGSLSSDPENDLLTYSWSAPAEIVLLNSNTINPSFKAPVVYADTNYSIKLKVSDGELDSPEDAIIVKVLAAQIPISNAGNDIAVNEGSTVTLDGSSSPSQAGITLTYKWTAPSGITLLNPNTVSPSFLAPEVSQDTPYSFSLIVNDGTIDSQPDEVTITVKQVNKIPVANAGIDQTVNEGVTVTLNGSLSSDGDNNILTYTWTAPTGITLSTLSTPTFTAPDVTQDTQFTIKLIVNDGVSSSSPDFVIITVKKVNQPPVADAGTDQIMNEGTLSSLDGSTSSDPDGDALSYLWTVPSGITLSSNTADKPTFTAPEVNADKDFRFTLTVNDGTANSQPDDVIITVKQVNKAPTANAGTDQSVTEKSPYSLNGSGSSDPDGDALTYKWIAPEGIILSSNTAVNPTFSTPEVSENTNFIFTLVVNDGKTNSAADQVIITVKKTNKAPLVNAGPDQTIDEGNLVTLDGSGSTDPDNDALVYIWTAPEGIILNSATASKPTFTAPRVTIDTSFTFSLSVNDGTVSSPEDEVVITVRQVNKAPVYTSIRNFFVIENEQVELTFEGSDFDNDPISFSIENLPVFLTLTQKTSGSAILSGKFSSINLGDNSFQLTLSDGSLSTVETISIYVSRIDHAPYVIDSIADISVKKRDPSRIIDLKTVFADDDSGDILTYSVFSNSNEQVVTAQISEGILILNFSSENTGLSEISVKALSSGKEANSTFKVEVGIPTGNIELIDDYVVIYPNPSSGVIQVNFKQTPETETWISVYTNTGHLILKALADNREKALNLKGNSPGLYFIRIGQKKPKIYKVVLK